MSWWSRVVERHWPPRWLYTTYERLVLDALDRDSLPQHVAVLADGNRRWARLNAPGQPLVAGYRAGAARLMEFVEWCDEADLQVVTLWVLSTDNLKRSDDDELSPLLAVIEQLVRELAATGRWRVQAVGSLELLPDEMVESLKASSASTDGTQGMQVNVAIAYGGRQELRDAVRSLLSARAEEGATLAEVAQTLEIEQISEHLYTKGQPDPDLIIRTSGEQRLSGFLLWQSAHSEFYFCEALWPDFRRVDFVRALRSYAQRERRFGR
ncbi:isoprenyl transferase [Tessaracoccus flavescens]|uniref:Isoprenyl transferase n=1 Tax=Tessaracoccus flavescens TaxID=399497 RepID=A0A1Q2CZJ5_9ACTN|nr:isoprenyl transferase [Tessaracoccus flavescens]AQP51464.1 isoprenyl transferase [Tessaracoccus flavescens]